MTNLLFVSYSSKISSNRVNVHLQPQNSVLSKPVASFLVCTLIFIEYKKNPLHADFSRKD